MGKAARQAARERIRQERLREQKRAKRNRILMVVGAAAVVVVLVVGIGYLVITSGGSSADREELYAALPEQTVQEDGSVVLADEDVQAPVVEVYADYQCPACQRFEEVSGATLMEMAGEGTAIVHYRPVSIFSQRPAPLSTNSLRAAAAARAAADHGKFVEYNAVVFENQPTEGRAGFAPEDLKEWASDLGIEDGAFADRIDSESDVANKFAEYYQELTSAAQADMGKDELDSVTMPQLMEWGNEQDIDSSFLDDTYVKEVLDATEAAESRYDGENAFSSTPSIYINGQALDEGTTFSADRLRSAIEGAEPGEVAGEPLASGDETESEEQGEADPSETEE